jgi:hypothetical protein
VTRRQGRRRKNLLDDLKHRRGYCELKEEALDLTMWRNRFARGFGPVVWQITDDDDDDESLQYCAQHSCLSLVKNSYMFQSYQIIRLSVKCYKSGFEPRWARFSVLHIRLDRTYSALSPLCSGCWDSLRGSGGQVWPWPPIPSVPGLKSVQLCAYFPSLPACNVTEWPLPLHYSTRSSYGRKKRPSTFCVGHKR